MHTESWLKGWEQNIWLERGSVPLTWERGSEQRSRKYTRLPLPHAGEFVPTIAQIWQPLSHSNGNTRITDEAHDRQCMDLAGDGAYQEFSNPFRSHAYIKLCCYFKPFPPRGSFCKGYIVKRDFRLNGEHEWTEGSSSSMRCIDGLWKTKPRSPPPPPTTPAHPNSPNEPSPNYDKTSEYSKAGDM